MTIQEGGQEATIKTLREATCLFLSSAIILFFIVGCMVMLALLFKNIPMVDPPTSTAVLEKSTATVNASRLIDSERDKRWREYAGTNRVFIDRFCEGDFTCSDDDREAVRRMATIVSMELGYQTLDRRSR